MFFFFNDTTTTEIYALSLHDALPIFSKAAVAAEADGLMVESHHEPREALCDGEQALPVEALLSLKEVLDRKSTRLNSSHANISYAVFCLKKKINHNLKNHNQDHYQC